MKNFATRLLFHASVIACAAAAGQFDYGMEDVGVYNNTSMSVVESRSNTALPLVYEEDGQRKVNAFMKDIQSTILDMNNLSYTLSKDEKHLRDGVRDMEKLQREGWIIRGFTGLEGKRSTYGDLSGFVAYHPTKNVITVIYHGTSGNAEGWDVNYGGNKITAGQLDGIYMEDFFDEMKEQLDKNAPTIGPNVYNSLQKFVNKCRQQKGGMTEENIQNLLEQINVKMENHPENHKLAELARFCEVRLDLLKSLKDYNASGIKGDIHEGFLKKYISTKKEVLELIKEVTNKMTAQQKTDLKIVFSGHSQAGGTANLALADICKNHGAEIFGEGFNNTTSNNMMGYFLSAARVGDADYKRSMHKYVGENNIIRQNVFGDPVPVAAPDKNLSELIAKVPALGTILGDFFDYDDTGILLLDDANDAWSRAKGMHIANGKDAGRYDTLDDNMRELLGLLLGEEKIPSFLVAPKKEQGYFSKFVPDFISKAGSAKKCLDLVSLVSQAKAGDKKAIKTLEELAELLSDRLAHLHYGFNREEVGAVFNPGVVGKDMDKMLAQGDAHTAKK